MLINSLRKRLDYFIDSSKIFFNKKPNIIAFSERDILKILTQIIKKNLIIINEKQIAYKTYMKNKIGYNSAAQARLLISYFNLLNNNYFNFVYSVGNHLDYVFSLIQKNGLFLYNNRSYYPRAEGIPSYLALHSFCLAYKNLKDPKLLDLSIKLAFSIRKHLYSKENGYLHDIGQNFSCINANALAIFSLLQLYKLTSENYLLEWIIDGLHIFEKSIRADGFFKYSGNYDDVFIYSYHNITTFYLNSIIKDEKVVEKINVSKFNELEKIAVNNMIKIIRDNGIILEKNNDYCYLITLITAYRLLKEYKNTTILREKLIKNISKFFFEDDFYLYYNPNKEILFKYVNDRYKDIIATEILYWLSI